MPKPSATTASASLVPADFYSGVVTLVLHDDVGFWGPERYHATLLGSFFANAARSYRWLAVAAHGLGRGDEEVRRWLAEEARVWLDCSERAPTALSETSAEGAFAATGVCNRAACERLARAYLAGPIGTGKYVYERHLWHLVNAMAHHYIGDERGVKASFAKLRTFGPFRIGGVRGVAWWKAEQRLAEECMLARRPVPLDRISDLADMNAAYFDWEDDLTPEPFFAAQALAHACIARDRGWRPPARDPHPSVPIRLLQLEPIPVPEREWQLLPRPDAAFVEAIRSAARQDVLTAAPRKVAARVAPAVGATKGRASKRVGSSTSKRRKLGRP
jgi:hypothetical protein